MTRRLACSGSVAPVEGTDALIERSLDIYEDTYGEPTQLVSGCAYGIDTEWLIAASERWPDIGVTLVVPSAPCNNSLVDRFLANIDTRLRTTVWFMPHRAGWSRSEIYMERNDEVQHRADALCAFPTRWEPQRRGSGTWATIRRFRKVGKPVLLSHIDKEPIWYEGPG